MAARPVLGNQLLQKLSAEDRGLLTPMLAAVELDVRASFERPNQPIERIVFPEAGIVSVVAEHPNGRRVEIGVIGREGMSGIAILLGNDRSPHSTYTQVAGKGLTIPAAALRAAIAQSRTLHTVMLRYVQVFMVQTAQTAIANARATLSERLARWLLMAQDRVESDALQLTHEFLALMMAVRRAGVTESLQKFEDQKLVRCGRAEIVILNRKEIEKIAGHYYGTPEAEYLRLLR